MDKKRIQIEINSPLMNEYLEENEDAKKVIEELQNEDSNYDIRILIDKPDMIATALGLAMSKRHNVEYYAKINSFTGAEYIFGFLKNSYFKEVEWANE